MAVTKGHGTVLQLSISSVFTAITQRTQVKPPNFSHADIETTNLDSSWKSFVAGIKEAGEVSFSGHYSPAEVTHAALWTSYGSGTEESWKVILADSGTAEFAFAGYIKEMNIGEAVTDNLVMLDVTIKITGAVTLTP